jgi:hypothetical protein
MKKIPTTMQDIALILILAWSPFSSNFLTAQSPEESIKRQEESEHSIQVALTTGWKLANTAQENEKRDLIAKGIDDFRELLSNYKAIASQQPRLEQKVAHTITVLQQRLASAERKLRSSQMQETDLASAQAELQKKALEIQDLRKELTHMQEENNQLRNKVTLLFHEQGIKDFAA